MVLTFRPFRQDSDTFNPSVAVGQKYYYASLQDSKISRVSTQTTFLFLGLFFTKVLLILFVSLIFSFVSSEGCFLYIGCFSPETASLIFSLVSLESFFPF
jgi:hypothetical protein